jgi:hypothetical protein
MFRLLASTARYGASGVYRESLQVSAKELETDFVEFPNVPADQPIELSSVVPVLQPFQVL